MYSLLGNRQGAEEDQDESRALEGTFPREGALKGEPADPGRLHEQQHNKQTGLYRLGPGEWGPHLSGATVTTLCKDQSRPRIPGGGGRIPGGGIPIGVPLPGGIPIGGPIGGLMPGGGPIIPGGGAPRPIGGGGPPRPGGY